MAHLYFTKAEIDKLLAESATKYPSLQMAATQVVGENDSASDEWFLLVHFEGLLVATISSALQFEAFVMAAFAVVGGAVRVHRPVGPLWPTGPHCACGKSATFQADCSHGNGQYSSTPLCDDHVELFKRQYPHCLVIDLQEPQEVCEGCERLFPRSQLKGRREPISREMFVLCAKCRREELSEAKSVSKPDLGKDQYIINYILAHEKVESVQPENCIDDGGEHGEDEPILSGYTLALQDDAALTQ